MRSTTSSDSVWLVSGPPAGFHCWHGGAGTGVEPSQPSPKVAKLANVTFEPVPPVTTRP